MNGNLHLYAGLTENEWLVLQTLSATKNKDSITQLLRGKIIKKYSSPICIPCEDEKLKKIIKHINLDLPGEIIKNIICHAYALGISPIELISRVIIFPLLSEPSVAGTGNAI